jgi:hypothetical protein
VSDLTVNDILGSRPSFKERAREAYLEAERIKADAYAELKRELQEEVIDFLLYDMKLSMPEIDDIEFTVSDYSELTPMITFRACADVPGFRTKFIWKTIYKKTSDTFKNDTEEIKERQLHVEMNTGGAWARVETLTDVGRYVGK